MEDMASLWSYQEDIEELKQKLLYTTLELESVRLETSEEMRKHKESVKQLLELLKVASQERDEARDQLQKLLNNRFIISPSNITEFTPILPQNLTGTHLVKPAKANSRSITESNGSSPVDSLFDSVSSPELSTININDTTNIAYVNQPFIQDYNNNNNTALVPRIDQFSGVMESLVKGKSLPQKGKFLQAVLEAGPLLQTLLVAGPLPRWRNPPPLQPLYIPPVGIKGCESEIVSEKAQPYIEMSCGSTQMMSMNVLSFGDGRPGSCLGGHGNSYILNGKRQRI